MNMISKEGQPTVTRARWGKRPNAKGTGAKEIPLAEDDEKTEYSGLSDEEFLRELRRHLGDRSWTFEHWLELERRGFAVTSGDPELHAAIEDERVKLNQAMRRAVEPLWRGFSGDPPTSTRQAEQTSV